MSDALTLARLSPLSRLVPARRNERLVTDGPVVNVDGTRGVVYAVFGGGVNVAIDDGSGGCLGTWLWEDVRVDTGEDAVRDRLCRLGLLPHALRDHPAAAVAAGMGMFHGRMLKEYDSIGRADQHGRYVVRMYDPHLDGKGGWDYEGKVRGPETGDAAKLAADLAALRLGCVLEEPDGYLIPLPGGGVGFVAKESA